MDNLISRIARGDQEAFSTLYDQCAGRILGLLLKILRHRPAAEDVLQEVFWQAWQQAGTFDARRASVLVWLIMLARSRAMDYLRRQSARSGPIPEPERQHEDDVAGVAINTEMAQATRTAIESLPEDQRKPIMLAFFSGMTHEEIAHQEELPLGTVKTRIRLGIRRLRESLSSMQRAVI
jgi:RNA polymerase sigma-70 factor (ECF subfamily)